MESFFLIVQNITIYLINYLIKSMCILFYVCADRSRLSLHRRDSLVIISLGSEGRFKTILKWAKRENVHLDKSTPKITFLKT